MRFLDPDTRILAIDKLEHLGFGFAMAVFLLLGLSIPPVWTFLAVVSVGGAFELGQWDIAHSLGRAGEPGFGFGLLDLAADALGAAIAIAAYCYLAFAPLPSKPWECYVRLPDYPQFYCTPPEEHWASSINEARGRSIVATSDSAHPYSLSPLPRSSHNGVPLARV